MSDDNTVPVSEQDEWLLAACAVLKPEIVAGLEESLFYLSETRAILKRIRQMRAEGADFIENRLLRELDANNRPLHDQLNRALTDLPSAHNWPWYVENLHMVRSKRERAGIAAELASGGDPQSLIERIRKLDARPQTASSMKSLVQQATAALQTEYEEPTSLQGIRTGFSKLDWLTNGLHAGHLWVIGARPGIGKTSLALNLASRAVLDQTSVTVYSLEMPAKELTQRMILSEAKLDRRMFREQQLTECDLERFKAASIALSGSPLTVHDNLHDLSGIIGSMTAASQTPQSPKLVLVDYLQLIRVRDLEHRYQQVGMASRSLKLAAMTCGCCIVALAQLSRAVERDNRRPNLSDLRESGDIEQDADLVGFLYSKEERTGYKPQSVDLIIGKNRHGQLGDVPLVFDHTITRFFERTPGL